MSISTLFAPNDYDLFCNSITVPPLTLGSGSISLDTISGTATGAIPDTPNFVLFDLSKINTTVTIWWRFTGVVTTSTANATLVFAEILPVEFRPITTMNFPCAVINNPAALGDLGYCGGIFQVTTAGVMSFSVWGINNSYAFLPAWLPPAPCGVADGSCTYRIA